MNAHRPWLIATVPGRSPEQCRAEVEAAKLQGADIAEIRLDLWPDEERRRLAALFPAPLPLIATYRSRAEGGAGSDDASQRAVILGELVRFPFWAIDRESARDPPTAAGRGSPSVLSSHLPEGTDWPELRARLLAADAAARFVKVVLPASLAAGLTLLDQLGSIGPPPGVVLHTTGPSGALFRVMGRTLGLAAVYCALGASASAPPVEPSQIPVPWLHRYLAHTPTAPVYALLGGSVGRSPSPALFASWFEEFDDPGIYIGLDVSTEGELAEALTRLPGRGFRGFNVTQPWKRAAYELADTLGPGSEACGAANVLTVSPGGAIEAANTDLAAMLRRFRELVSQGDWDGGELLVAGSGGSARSCLAAGRASGARIRLIARDHARAAGLASEFGAELAESVAPGPAGLVLNATSIGRPEAGPAGVNLAPYLGSGTILLDLVYAAQAPVLRQMAMARGAVYEDGFRLLVYQAAAAYELWMGHPVPEARIRARLAGPP